MGILTELFSDENPSVRIRFYYQLNDLWIEYYSVIKAAINFILELGGEVIPLFGPSLKNASEDNKWRVRMETLDGIVRIAQQFRVFPSYLLKVV